MSTRGGQKDGWGDSLRLTIDHVLLFESLRSDRMYYIDDFNALQLKDQRGYILGSMKAKNLLDELATLGVLVVEYDRSASQNRWAKKHEVTFL